MCMKLVDSTSTRLSVKWLAESHGERKHLKDSIYGRKNHDYPGKEGKRWKRNEGLDYNGFNEYGKIQEVLGLTNNIEINEKDRLLRTFSEGDQIPFPKLPIDHKVIEDDGPLRSIKCTRYYV